MRTDPTAPPPDDRDLAGPTLGLAVAGLLVLTALAAGVTWWALPPDRRADPAATTPDERPPAPRLQADPAAELAAWRRAETERLRSYRWVDRESGVAAVPVERAVELLLEDAAEERR